jgi:hypothetical protein
MVEEKTVEELIVKRLTAGKQCGGANSLWGKKAAGTGSSGICRLYSILQGGGHTQCSRV